jgi:hypothetical protein
VQVLDLAAGSITTVAEEAGHDFLGPKMTADGTLYAIRRPHTRAGAGSPWRAFTDVVLFPVRLTSALFGFLNFFSMRYSGKPLVNGRGALQKEPDPRQMFIWGNLIDAEAARRKARRGDAAPALVPSTWKLVRRRPGGEPEELASSVLSFDLCADGSIVWSNGSAIEHLGPDGQRTALCRDEHIEQVVALG